MLLTGGRGESQATSELGWVEGTTGEVLTGRDLNWTERTAVYRQTKKKLFFFLYIYKKYYGFKLTETSWWVMSKVRGWRWYLGVYEKIPAANTPKCSQGKPQPFRLVKLRKSCICSSHILPGETHTLRGWRIQAATMSGPKHTYLAQVEDDSSLP